MPKNYEGTEITTHKMTDVLSAILTKVSHLYQESPDLLLAAWAPLVGPRLAPMAEAVRFFEGVLTVKVKNSSLLSLLNCDRFQLLLGLRKQFPKLVIKNIVFRIG